MVIQQASPYTAQLLVSVRERSQPGAQTEAVLIVLTHAPRKLGSHYEPGKGHHREPAQRGSGGRREVEGSGGEGGGVLLMSRVSAAAVLLGSSLPRPSLTLRSLTPILLGGTISDVSVFRLRPSWNGTFIPPAI